MTNLTLANPTRMQATAELGQSIWLDNVQRSMFKMGEFKTTMGELKTSELGRLIAAGLRGLTSNPAIFEHAIGNSNDYDDAIARAPREESDLGVFERLAVADIRSAADAFRPLYNASQGADGYVSLEVAPQLARDTDGAITEGRRLWKMIDRPNAMIKIPGTREGWPAIERLLYEGININVTLLFSIQNYQQVSEAYLRALERRLQEGKPIDWIASVASFFVSRVDSEVDKRLDAQGGTLQALKGKAAIANAKLAYVKFQEIMTSPRWQALRQHKARPQRLLWASTGAKNPAYSDLLYVDTLIGRDTINTLPPQTLAQFEDHGTVMSVLRQGIPQARETLAQLACAGIDLDDVTAMLEEDGIKKFVASFQKVLNLISAKRQ